MVKSKSVITFFTSENDSRRRFHQWKTIVTSCFRLVRTRWNGLQKSFSVFGWGFFSIQKQRPHTQKCLFAKAAKASHVLFFISHNHLKLDARDKSRPVSIVIEWIEKVFWRCVIGDETLEPKGNEAPQKFLLQSPGYIRAVATANGRQDKNENKNKQQYSGVPFKALRMRKQSVLPSSKPLRHIGKRNLGTIRINERKARVWPFM